MKRKMNPYAPGNLAFAALIWPWSYAPDEYKALSGHGGDEDFVVFIPEGMYDAFWVFGDYMKHFGWGDGPHKVDGGIVIIYAHA
jgi:hypothetical protein